MAAERTLAKPGAGRMSGAMRNGAASGRHEGRLAPFATLLAITALLVQALLPAAALAASTRNSGDVEITLCTGRGLEMVKLGGDAKPAKGFAGLPCQDCLGAATAAVTAQPPLAQAPVRYSAPVARTSPATPPPTPMARGPPRPFGQAPPVRNT